MYLVYHTWKKLKQEMYNEGLELFVVVQVEILGYNIDVRNWLSA